MDIYTVLRDQQKLITQLCADTRCRQEGLSRAIANEDKNQENLCCWYALMIMIQRNIKVHISTVLSYLSYFAIGNTRYPC